jgi:hypothetical protein
MRETGTRIISLVVSEKKMIEPRIYDEDQQFDPKDFSRLKLR